MIWFRRVFVGLLVLALLLGGAVYLLLWAALPKLDGSIAVRGLSAPVEIVRDRNGVPHIFAQDRADSLYALGFVHAQDRLWQMEMTRRLGAGRLAEILGEEAVNTDRFMRVLNLWRLAEKNYATLDMDSQRLVDAYVAGVNAQIRERGRRLPPEFLILNHRPEAWSPADSLVWIKLMALDLSTNWAAELFRMRLGRRLTPVQIRDLYPSYRANEPRGPVAKVTDPNLALHPAVGPNAGLEIAPSNPGIGSNNWAVSGKQSASGKPLLANDPHLRLRTPAVWYFAHLHWPGHNLVGATLPGLPSIVLGRNDRIAWTFANTGSDVQDLYIELVDADSEDHYLTPDGPRPFVTRQEVIRVKDASPVQFTARSTRHGPVLSDVVSAARDAQPIGSVLALAWTGLDERDRTAKASLDLALATDWESFVEVLRDFHTPQQNIIYADVDGNIGFISPARVPLRHADNEINGYTPQPGWEAKYDWKGFVPFEELPSALNPRSGRLLSANHKIVADDYPYHLTSEWAHGYRARRISELLKERDRHSTTSFSLMQQDTLSLFAKELLPLMLRAVPTSDLAKRSHDMLSVWNLEMQINRPEPLVFAAWHRELTRLIFADELGGLFARAWGGRARFLMRVLRGEGAEWCDDVATEARESCGEILNHSLERAVTWLAGRYGDDPDRWLWGEAHRAVGFHVPFGQIPILKDLFEVVVPSAGGTYTVNVGHYSIANSDDPFANIHAPSMRAIYDLDDLERSLFMSSTGQSGNPISNFHDNFAEAWQVGDYIMIPTRREAVRIGALGVLTLSPQ